MSQFQIAGSTAQLCSSNVNPGQLGQSLATPTKTKMQALPRSHSESSNTDLNEKLRQRGLKREEVEEQEESEEEDRMARWTERLAR